MADRIAVMDRGVAAAVRLAGRPLRAAGEHVRRALHRLGAEQLHRRALRRRRAARRRRQRRRSASAAAPSRAAISAAGLTATIRPERVRVVEAGSRGGHDPRAGDARRAARAEGRRAPRARGHRRARRAAARRATGDRERARAALRPGPGARLRRRHRTGGALMARVRLEGVSKRFGAVTAHGRRRRSTSPTASSSPSSGRPGAGQDDDAARDPRPREARLPAASCSTTRTSPTSGPAIATSRSCSRTSRSTPTRPCSGTSRSRSSSTRCRRPRSRSACSGRPRCSRSRRCSTASPRKLSGGERQRVAIGRAIVRDPRAYLFDEPLSALDALLRLEMRSELKYLQRDLNRTLVYVTHDQVEAMSMADRMAVLRDGAVQQVATPEDIYHRPVNRFVATTIGSPPMNFLPATARRQNGSVVIEHPSFSIRVARRPRRARRRRRLLRRRPPRGRPRRQRRERHRSDRLRHRAARRRDRRRPAPRRPRRQGARAADRPLRGRRGRADHVRPAPPAPLRRPRRRARVGRRRKLLRGRRITRLRTPARAPAAR